jgi:hypothetical protein
METLLLMNDRTLWPRLAVVKLGVVRRMKRLSPILALLLVGCATPTETRKAVIRDAAGKPLRHAQVELLGEPPRFFPFGIASGNTYTETATDSQGACMLTYPKRERWHVDVKENRRQFMQRRIIKGSDPIEVTVVPRPPLPPPETVVY